MARRYKSTLPPWLDSVEGMATVERTLRQEIAAADDDPDLRRSLMRDYIRVSEALDRKLTADLNARKAVQEIRDRDLAEMNEGEVEQMFADHAARRGLRNVETMRDRLRDNIAADMAAIGIELTIDQVMTLVDRWLPTVPQNSQRLGLATKLRHTHDRMLAELDAAGDELEIAMEAGDEIAAVRVIDPYAGGAAS